MMKEKLGKRKGSKKFMFIGIFIGFHIPQTHLLTIEINKFSPKWISLHICESFKFFFKFMSFLSVRFVEYQTPSYDKCFSSQTTVRFNRVVRLVGRQQQTMQLSFRRSNLPELENLLYN